MNGGEVARAGTAQGVFLQRGDGCRLRGLAQVEPGQRMFDDGEQQMGLDRIGDPAGAQIDQGPGRQARQGAPADESGTMPQRSSRAATRRPRA